MSPYHRIRALSSLFLFHVFLGGYFFGPLGVLAGFPGVWPLERFVTDLIVCRGRGLPP